jgi:hypothetical protein
MTTIDVRQATDALGIDPFDLAETLRNTASDRLATLGSRIRHRTQHDGSPGVRELVSFDEFVAQVRNLLAAAIAADEVWRADE